MNITTRYDSPLGAITLVSAGCALTGLYFDGQKHRPDLRPGLHEADIDLPVFRQTKEWLDIYFSGGIPAFVPPLSVQAGDFRRRVWEALLAIPYGTTTTYGAIARAIACERGLQTMSAQAVGGAVGRNPVALIIPCHRVVGSDGSLTGYAGGLDRKRWLLQLESAL
ncbi:MAG: methylated-DNA-[protein]-cysteine S-methyltransferase [bacterium P3]|nr:MAG: methylated-DNA-[protein]-cysteine S-methyltransferase [bacterium P3]KWW39031.1 MAG: methylated-DNA-[protein]-cysteine S-methyltransferase [bacterium F083]